MVDEVRRIAAGEWRELRALRLAALTSDPQAFGSTYEETAARPEQWWREWTVGLAASNRSAMHVALDASAGWIGLTGVHVSEDAPHQARVFSVFVAAEHRGRERGIAKRLLAASVAWTREATTVAELILDVQEDQPRACAFYRSNGFVETGFTQPFSLDPARKLVEMRYAELRGPGRQGVRSR